MFLRTWYQTSGTADGGVDVTQVIAAINWVVDHRHDNGMNIRVLNLSFGTDSAQAYTMDPLAFAAEQAWRHGIVVVVSTGGAVPEVECLLARGLSPQLPVMNAIGVPQIAALLLLLQRGLEEIYSERNTRRLIAEGGREAGRDYYPVVAITHLAWIAATMRFIDASCAAPAQPGNPAPQRQSSCSPSVAIPSSAASASRAARSPSSMA